MDAFAETVAGWHEFYLLAGTAAATLIGLLFVAVSLHIDVVTHTTAQGARTLANQSFSNFIYILAFSLVFLIPQTAPAGLGLPLLIMGALGCVGIMRRWWVTRRMVDAGDLLGATPHPVRNALLLAAYVTLLVVAVRALNGDASDLYWLVWVIIWLLADAALSAWNLLLRLGNLKSELGKSGAKED